MPDNIYIKVVVYDNGPTVKVVTTPTSQLPYTAENEANKTDDIAGNSTSSVKYASIKAVYDWVVGLFSTKSYAESMRDEAKTYADSLVVGLWDDRGSFDASSGAYPSTGGSGAAGAILKGDVWTISVAGTLPTGQVVEVGDIVRAMVNTPGNTQANWTIQQNNIGYTAENSANKTDSMSGNTSSSTKYLSAKGVYDWVVGAFQAVLVSGTNIKTIGGVSLLGSGNVDPSIGLVEDATFEDKSTSISDQTYTLVYKAKYPFNLNSLDIKASVAGTCTAALKINSTNITGISSVSVSTTNATANATGANAVAVGDTLSLVITSASSLNGLVVTIKFTRTA